MGTSQEILRSKGFKWKESFTNPVASVPTQGCKMEKNVGVWLSTINSHLDSVKKVFKCLGSIQTNYEIWFHGDKTSLVCLFFHCYTIEINCWPSLKIKCWAHRPGPGLCFFYLPFLPWTAPGSWSSHGRQSCLGTPGCCNSFGWSQRWDSWVRAVMFCYGVFLLQNKRSQSKTICHMPQLWCSKFLEHA